MKGCIIQYKFLKTKKKFIMLTEYIQITYYELDVYSFISGLVLNSLIC